MRKGEVEKRGHTVTFLEENDASDSKRIRTDPPRSEEDQNDYELDYVLEDENFGQKPRRKGLKNQDTDSDEDEKEAPDSPDSGDIPNQDEIKMPNRRPYGRNVEGEEFVQELEYTDDGIRIVPFNMAEELEEGTIDDAGCYVPNKDKDVNHDNWLKGITRADVEKAREARDRLLEKQALAESKLRSDHEIDPTKAWLGILAHLEQGESVAKAMRRLSPDNRNKKLSQRWKKRRQVTGRTSVEQMDCTDKDNDEKDREKALSALISYSNHLTELGEYDILDLTYEKIVRKLRASEVIPDTWMPSDPLPII